MKNSQFMSKARLIESIVKQYPEITYDDANDMSVKIYRRTFTKQQFSQVKKKIGISPYHDEHKSGECFRDICRFIREYGQDMLDELLEIERKYGRTMFFEQVKYLKKQCETR